MLQLFFGPLPFAAHFLGTVDRDRQVAVKYPFFEDLVLEQLVDEVDVGAFYL